MRVLKNKKIQNLFIYGIGQAVNLLSPILVIPYIIAVCGEDGLGKIGVGFSVSLILCSIIDYGSYIKGVKDISLNRHDDNYLAEKIKAIYLSKFFLLCLMSSVYLLCIFTIPFLQSEKPLFLYSLLIVVAQFINPAWFFQGTENYKWLAFINVVSKLIYVAGVFFYINTNDDYIYANLFFAAGGIIANSVGAVYLIIKYKLKSLEVRPAVRILKEEFTFSVSQVFLSVYQFFPIVIISFIVGDYAAGQYRVIDQVIMILKSYLTIFFYFIYSNVCYEISKDLNGGLRVWKLYNGLNFILITVIVLGFYIFSDFIFLYFNINPADVALFESYFSIALIIPFLIAVSLPLRQLMFAFDKNRVYIAITIGATLLNVALLIAGTSLFNLKGSLISIIIVEVLVIILYLASLKNIYNQKENEV